MIGSRDTVSMKFVEISSLPEERQHGQPSDMRLETNTPKTRQGQLVDLHSNPSQSWEKNSLRLGRGFKDFSCSPLFGEDSHFDYYFSKGLKPPIRQS